MLQLGTGGEVNYANYWGLAVSNKSLNKTLAYPFILNSTTDPQTSVTYLNATSRPPALRSLITLNSKNPGLGIFARQALTARSWYKIDDTSIDSIFSRMIDSVITGQLSATDALNQAEEKITQLMRR
jgi:ABC-type glycerol-3-phosphate transport system substrate-binding protein